MIITVGFAVLAALLPPDASTEIWIVLAVLATVGGALIVGLLVFACLLASAAVRQRNELRSLVAPSSQEHEAFRAELQDFVARFSGFVRAREQTQPRRDPFNFMPDAFDPDAQRLAEYNRATLARYYEEYRPTALRLLGQAEPLGYVADHAEQDELCDVDKADELPAVVALFDGLVGPGAEPALPSGS